MNLAVPTANDRIRISESQSIADAQRRKARAEARYRERSEQEHREDERTVDAQRQAHWRSKRDANDRQAPTQLEPLLAWFQREVELDLPEALHSAGIWFDRVSPTERDEARRKKEPIPLPVGGSLLATPAYDPAFQLRLEGSPNAKDESGDLLSPFRSAFGRLREERRHTADLLEAIARADFDWRAVVGRPFYGRSRIPNKDGSFPRVLVMALPEDVMRAVLESGLGRLWQLNRDRSPYIGADE